MNDFPVTANVEFQGDKVLRYKEIISDSVHYRALGFSKPEIEVIDHRKCGLDAINQVINSGITESFPVLFNTPASVDIQEDNDKIIVSLFEPENLDPKYMLWFAVGLGASIPAYDYIYSQINSLENNHYAFFSIYKSPTEPASSGL